MGYAGDQHLATCFERDFIDSFGTSPMERYAQPPYRPFNRYSNIVPYDLPATRVLLQNGSVYINASRVTAPSCSCICTQGPMRNTVAHFWLMVAEQRIRCIAMLTDTAPAKCEKYWPPLGQPTQFAEYEIAVELVEEAAVMAALIRRVFRVTRRGESLAVVQLQYLGWPDHSVPRESEQVDYLAENCRVYPPNLVIHCSAGVGRSGTLLTIIAMLGRVVRMRSTRQLVAETVQAITELRRQRAELVQCLCQFRFIVRFLINKMPTHAATR